MHSRCCLSASAERTRERWAGNRNAYCTYYGYIGELNILGKLSKIPTLHIKSAAQERSQSNSKYSFYLKNQDIKFYKCGAQETAMLWAGLRLQLL